MIILLSSLLVLWVVTHCAAILRRRRRARRAASCRRDGGRIPAVCCAIWCGITAIYLTLALAEGSLLWAVVAGTSLGGAVCTGLLWAAQAREQRSRDVGRRQAYLVDGERWIGAPELGITTAQALDATRIWTAAAASAGISLLELTPGLDDDDRTWIRQMRDLDHGTPGEQAQRWLAAHTEEGEPDA